MKKSVWLVSLAVFTAFAVNAASKTPIDGSKLKQTVIAPYLQFQILPGTSVVYSAAFQSAWNKVADSVIGEALPLVAAVKQSEPLHDRLVSEKDLPSGGWFALAGLKKDSIEEKVKAALQKFNRQPGFEWQFKDKLDILAYAFLGREVLFAEQFEKYNDALSFNGTTVKSFGLKEFRNQKKIAEQVKIYEYLDPDNFIVGLKTKDGDELVVAKSPPYDTLQKLIDSVSDRLKSASPGTLGKGDKLLIPLMDFDVIHRFKELEAPFSPSEKSGYYFFKNAAEAIQFKLNDDSTAALSGDAALSRSLGAAGGSSRQMALDKPYLLYLKKSGSKYPYFAVWVDNAEILVK